MLGWRALFRGIGVAGALLWGWVCYLPAVRVRPAAQRDFARALWLQRLSSQLLRVLGIRVSTRGPIPRRGLLVSNHLSYLDILVLAAAAPAVFVAKREVASWPLFGWFARAAGTVFVNRESKISTTAIAGGITELLQRGMLLVLFPEGTSTDGHTVLSFRSSLLEPAVRLRSPTTAACLRYSLRDGDVANEVCYWRDMTLLPHFLNLLRKQAVWASVHFDASAPAPDRKTFARELHQQVLALHEAGQTACAESLT